MDINSEAAEKKLLFDKIIKLIPKTEMSDLMKKLGTEQEEKNSNQPEDIEKILRNDNILYEDNTQENEMKENIDKTNIQNIPKVEPEKEKEISVNIIDLLQQDKEKLANKETKEENVIPVPETNINDNVDVNININLENKEINMIPPEKQNIVEKEPEQMPKKEEETTNYIIDNQPKVNPNPNPTVPPEKNIIPVQNQNINATVSQNQNMNLNVSPIQNSTQNLNNVSNANNNKMLAKKRRPEIEESYNSTKEIEELKSKLINRRTNSYNNSQNYSQQQQQQQQQISQFDPPREKQILSKLVEKKGFLFIFNLLTKANLSRQDPLEKYIDELIGGIGLLKISLYLFQIYFEMQLSEKNKKDDYSDILIESDGMNKIQEAPMTNNYSHMNMSMNMNNYQRNMNPIPYNQTYPQNNGYNTLRNSILSNGNLMNNNMYDSTPENKEKNISKYFNNNFSYDQKKLEAKRRDNRVSFSLKSTGLSLHFHKDEMGNVYKYSKHHFFGKDICVFYCCDKECRATANYYMSNLRFVLVNKHNKEYNDHIYVKKPDRDRKVMDDMKKRPEHEGQMFKRGDGSKLVKWYNMV